MTLDLARIRAILFDIDGTLSDTDDLWVDRLERVLYPLHGLLPGRQTRPLARRITMAIESPANSLYTLLDRFQLDAPAFRLLQFVTRHAGRKHAARYQIIPGVAELLANLCPSFPLAVVSARDAESSLSFLDHFQIRHFFQAIATAQTCHYTKPFPDPVIWAASQLAVPPANCLMVGDTSVDIRAGRGAGTQTLGVLCGFGTEKELRRAGADEILPGTADLAKIFDLRN